MRKIISTLLAVLVFSLSYVSASQAKIVGCLIAFEAEGRCKSPERCKAGFNKVWFEDAKGQAGTQPNWLRHPSKAEEEIYYPVRNKFVDGARDGDPQTFAASFGDVIVFEPNTGRTANYEFYYNCKAQPE